MKSNLQTLTLVLLCIYSATAEAPSKSYLPPEEGYSYDAPNVPFPSPAPSYKPPPTYRPRPVIPQQPPSYPTGSPSYISTPRPYVPPKPSGGYGPGPYEQSGSAISPVGNEGAGLGGGEFDHLRQPHVPGMPFNFNYAVKDDYYGTDFGHQASSDGDQVRGEYRVLLPDGRLQIVKYIADWKDGYTAEVTYQGEAKYPTGAPAASGSNNAGAGYRPQPAPGNYPVGPLVPAKPVVSYPSPGFAGGSYNPAQQPGPAIPSYPAASSPRPTYGQQPVSGYGGSQQAPSATYGQPLSTGYGNPQSSGYGSVQQQSSGGYPSSPSPSYSTGAASSDYGSYKK